MIKRFIWALVGNLSTVFFLFENFFYCSIINKHNIHNKVKKKITGGFFSNNVHLYKQFFKNLKNKERVLASIVFLISVYSGTELSHEVNMQCTKILQILN